MPVVLALVLAAKAHYGRHRNPPDESAREAAEDDGARGPDEERRPGERVRRAPAPERAGSEAMEAGPRSFDPGSGRMRLAPERSRRRGAGRGLPSTIVDLDETPSDADTSLETVAMTDADGREESTFRNDVREEWIDAMFGKGFFSDDGNDASEGWRDLSVKQGEGEAKVGKFVTYGALLDPGVDGIDNSPGDGAGEEETPLEESLSRKTKSTPLLLSGSLSNLSLLGPPKPAKIGATVSRVPLGVYARSVSVRSEAYWAGVEPGSVLVDVNGIGLLGETAVRALERLWRYSGERDGGRGAATGPAVLRFYRRRPYSVTLLGSSPLEGIEWGPCANLGLIQRCRGLAAERGVRRGSLVLAVNGVGPRTLDHAGAARELSRAFDGGRNRVVITCGYTPASSRSGSREERAEKRGVVAGGVEVRPRPVEYSAALAETFFACTAPSGQVEDAGEGGEGSAYSELAAYVAAGRVLPPGKLSEAAARLGICETRRKGRPIAGNVGVGPCPAVEPDRLLEVWDPLVSLVRSMSYQAAGCCETSFVERGGPFRTSGEAAHSPSECMTAIEEIANHSTPGVPEQVFEAHLMQLLGVATCALAERENSSDETNDDKLSEKLLDIMVDVALKDINLCQRLFFLLRAFIGALEEKTPNADPEKTLSAKLLRYAQRRLSGRMFDKSECREADRHCSEGYPMSRENSSASSFRKFARELDVVKSESPLGKQDVVAAGAPPNRPRPSGFPDREAGATVLNLENADSGESPSTDNLSCQTPASQSHTEDSTIPTNNDGTKKPKKGKSIKKIQQLLKGGKSKNNVKKVPQDGPLPPCVGVSKSKQGPSFSFTNVFHKQSSSLQTIGGCPSPISSPPALAPLHVPTATSLTMSQKFENLSWILRRIDSTCSAIERNLIKSFPQKMADLALFPWSASRESALASVTQSFRSELRRMNSDSDSRFPILNPVDSLEQLTSVDADECFILPSAHFPMLLCFHSRHSSGSPSSPVNTKLFTSPESSFDTLYRTRVEVLGLRSTVPLIQKANGSGEAYVVQGSVAGVVQESGTSELYINPKRPSQREVISHQWTKNNALLFETSSNWGFPQTLSFKISTISRNIDSRDDYNVADDKGSDMGCGFVDLSPLWNQVNQGATSFSPSVTSSARVYLFDNAEEFDQHGDAEGDFSADEKIEIQYRISVEVVPAEVHPQKRLLLYKHGDDLRQELLAIQFIERCNQILKASGLDLKLKTFRCLPVASHKGFIEWVSGTVPLSQLCQSAGSSHSGSNGGSRQGSRCQDSMNLDESQHSAPVPAPADVIDQSGGIEAQKRSWCKYQALRGLCQRSNGTIIENPIQDFLRSAAYDESAPYFVKKDVMDNYVKSCAGYCVITYLLGVGDRHLDNILLHQNGHLLHCDYSFILGHDPKTYLPMRITEEMIRGFGGRESDNYSRFLSFTGAAFLTLRRHSNLHSLLSQIRNMIYSNMRDVSQTQQPEEAILAMRGRFRLDLSDDEALTYIEHVVEKSITSKMWRAVDVMHSLGKHLG